MTQVAGQVTARELVTRRTPGSLAAVRSGKALVANEVRPSFAMPSPLYAASVDGAYLTDVDGNRFLDLSMGFGACLLGHRPSFVDEAMRSQLSRGWHTVLPTPLQHELAELVIDAVPCAEQVVFANSGTEATMYALRAARAVTGRTRIGVFGGGYHGTHDYALVTEDLSSEPRAPRTRTIGRGVPDVVRDDTMLALPYRDLAAFDLIRERAHELAAVMIQPVQNTTPRLDNREFLAGLRAVCDETGVLLVFDEVVTGFRLAYGGGQAYYGVVPDLAAFGKILGGGTPIGALAGRRDVMSVFQGSGSSSAFSGGTFSGNPLSMAAGIATLEHLRLNQDTLYPDLHARSRRFADAVSGHIATRVLPVTLMEAASMHFLQFTEGPIETSRDLGMVNRAAEEEFYLQLMGRGILVPGVHLYFLATAHTDEHIDELIDGFCGALDACRELALL